MRDETSYDLHYSLDDFAEMPLEVARAMRPCASPHGLAALRTGETVVDLGCGAGFDAFIAARAVGPSGRVVGIDADDQALAIARAGEARLRFGNVSFVVGRMESLPLPDACADAAISNCVLSLSDDLKAAASEIHRILKPGGRAALAVLTAADDADQPSDARPSSQLYTQHDAQRDAAPAACEAAKVCRDEEIGALVPCGVYEEALAKAGFRPIEIAHGGVFGEARGIESVVFLAFKDFA